MTDFGTWRSLMDGAQICDFAYGGTNTDVFVRQSSDFSLIEQVEVPTSMRSLAIAPDMAYIFVADIDDEVQVISTETFEIVETITVASGTVNQVDVSPNGLYLMFASQDDTAYVRSIPSWGSVATLTESSSTLNTCSISQDWAGYGGFDDNLYIHNTDDFSHEVTLTDSGSTLRASGFSPDDETFAYGGDADTVWVVDTNDWTTFETLTGPSTIEHIDFSSDGKWIGFCSSSDVYIYSTDDWSHEETITYGSDTTRAVSFSDSVEYVGFNDGNGETVYVVSTSDWSLVDSFPVGNSVYGTTFITVPQFD